MAIEHNDYWSNRRIAELEAEVERLREALTLIAEGHTAPTQLAQLAVWSPHGIGPADR